MLFESMEAKEMSPILERVVQAVESSVFHTSQPAAEATPAQSSRRSAAATDPMSQSMKMGNGAAMTQNGHGPMQSMHSMPTQSMMYANSDYLSQSMHMRGGVDMMSQSMHMRAGAEAAMSARGSADAMSQSYRAAQMGGMPGYAQQSGYQQQQAGMSRMPAAAMAQRQSQMGMQQQYAGMHPGGQYAGMEASGQYGGMQAGGQYAGMEASGQYGGMQAGGHYPGLPMGSQYVGMPTGGQHAGMATGGQYGGHYAGMTASGPRHPNTLPVA
eukprot:gnl/TRDRNA2_/TRDRNA2_160205_c1_seq1.p1 gnl/TRDRNA2_/TRDRNA2_160205_c1~~gnl/TRDRNA2_/TRDRNA2_160205_c1_seq1.p1  ORF type:complete len:270 (-),score=51.46 gnl/TRDRNA2_/TRDRNA2_160205_c1_seq1:32-841(-)